MSIAELIAASKADGSYYENAWLRDEGNAEINGEFESRMLPELFAAADSIGSKYQTEQNRIEYLEELLDAIYGVEGFEKEIEKVETELKQLRGF